MGLLTELFHAETTIKNNAFVHTESKTTIGITFENNQKMILLCLNVGASYGSLGSLQLVALAFLPCRLATRGIHVGEIVCAGD